MSHISYTVLDRYLPPTVKRIIARGGDCWIGEVDDTTVLKYPQKQESTKRGLQIEAKMLGVLGSHPRIVQSKGLTDNGLLLEFAAHGDLHDYLTAHPETSLEQRLTWCIQATEAIGYAHSKRILHCDIRHDNFLLDGRLDLKLADFQGQHFSADGTVLLDGLSLESTKAYLPRTPADYARITTDLFALGSAIYFIMMGKEVFADLDNTDEDEIERRFRAQQFPTDQHACWRISEKCWKQFYSSAQQVLVDLKGTWDAIACAQRLDCDAQGNFAVSNEDDALPPPTPWLAGLCDEARAPTVPPRMRQLVGFD